MNAKDQAFPTAGGCPGLSVRDYIAIEMAKALVTRHEPGHRLDIGNQALSIADALIVASGGKL